MQSTRPPTGRLVYFRQHRERAVETMTKCKVMDNLKAESSSWALYPLPDQRDDQQEQREL